MKLHMGTHVCVHDILYTYMYIHVLHVCHVCMYAYSKLYYVHMQSKVEIYILNELSIKIKILELLLS